MGEVPLDQSLQSGDLLGVLQAFGSHHLRVHIAGEITAVIQHVGDAARHAGAEIAARRPEDDDTATGHVFTTVIADGLDNGIDAAVADAEALARRMPRM